MASLYTDVDYFKTYGRLCPCVNANAPWRMETCSTSFWNEPHTTCNPQGFSYRLKESGDQTDVKCRCASHVLSWLINVNFGFSCLSDIACWRMTLIGGLMILKILVCFVNPNVGKIALVLISLFTIEPTNVIKFQVQVTTILTAILFFVEPYTPILRHLHFWNNAYSRGTTRMSELTRHWWSLWSGRTRI